ncbi:MAG: alcohol dehydrogenase catalytic domain-containing protein [Gemmatimonadetes bacterium]|nr:alcohol dehydrogenase catalytic domain-containing protein [Gemmatimonadota bacterium]
MTERLSRRAELIRPGEVRLRSVPVPEPGPGELVIRVEAALTCGTDLKMYRRGHARIPLPAPFGHEFSGRVARVGAGVTRFREGDAIAAVPTAPCGVCDLCRRGRDHLCPLTLERIALGAFADDLLLPAHLVSQNVFERPATLAAETAALLEPLACVVHGLSRVPVAEARTVTLLGDGPIALLFVQLLAAKRVENLLITGHHASRLAVAAALGARPLDGSDPGLRERVLEQSAGRGADIVIECIGEPASWQLAQTLAARGGTVLLYGGCAAGTRVSFDAATLHYDEVDLKGAFHYGRNDVREALELLSDGAIDGAALITHRRPLDRLDEAIQLALTRAAVKVAVLP